MSPTPETPPGRHGPVPTHPAPPLEVDLVGGGRFVLADAHRERFTLVVFYRGWHCPICRGYLVQLDRAVDELASLGVEVVAVSGDDAERAGRSVTEWHLEHLRVGYAQSVTSMRAWGLFVSKSVKDPEPELFGEPGVFLVSPDGTIYMVALNSMPAARPRVEDLVGAIRFFVERDYPPRGEA
ncbi:MAG: peroxiredoxin-like family protein [Acidimicrobiales bacterium]